MKRPLISILCAALFLATCCVSTFAAVDPGTVVRVNLQDDQAISYYRITLSGTVVANTGDALAVYLDAPDNMAVQEGDTAANVQVLPMYTAGAQEPPVFTDNRGEPVGHDKVLPGQRLKVTFRYHWREGSPRTAMMDRCLSAQLVGNTLQAKSTARVDGFAENVLVGTLVQVDNNRLQVYVEAGRVKNGGTTYIVQGLYSVAVPGNASVTDENGRMIPLRSLQPFQRVTLQAGDAVWASSMPPQYAPQSVTRVQRIADGQRLFSPDDLAKAMLATVEEVRLSESGTIYVVSPTRDWERRLSPTYTVAAPLGAMLGTEAEKAVYRSVKQGDLLRIPYEGLVYGDGVEARIDWAFSFEILPADAG